MLIFGKQKSKIMAQKREREIRITNVPDHTINAINNISKNLGVSVSTLLKPKIFDIVQSYPEELRMIKPLDQPAE